MRSRILIPSLEQRAEQKSHALQFSLRCAAQPPAVVLEHGCGMGHHHTLDGSPRPQPDLPIRNKKYRMIFSHRLCTCNGIDASSPTQAVAVTRTIFPQLRLTLLISRHPHNCVCAHRLGACNGIGASSQMQALAVTTAKVPQLQLASLINDHHDCARELCAYNGIGAGSHTTAASGYLPECFRPKCLLLFVPQAVRLQRHRRQRPHAGSGGHHGQAAAATARRHLRAAGGT